MTQDCPADASWKTTERKQVHSIFIVPLEVISKFEHRPLISGKQAVYNACVAEVAGHDHSCSLATECEKGGAGAADNQTTPEKTTSNP